MATKTRYHIVFTDRATKEVREYDATGAVMVMSLEDRLASAQLLAGADPQDAVRLFVHLERIIKKKRAESPALDGLLDLLSAMHENNNKNQ